jgi:hypothetical protein
MVTRRTPMKSRAGLRPRAARAGGGPMNDMPSPRQVQAKATGLRRDAGTEFTARVDAADRAVRRATRNAVHAWRSSVDDATEAGRVVRGSMKEAFRAVVHAWRRIAKRVSSATRAVMPAPKPVRRHAA